MERFRAASRPAAGWGGAANNFPAPRFIRAHTHSHSPGIVFPDSLPPFHPAKCTSLIYINYLTVQSGLAFFKTFACSNTILWKSHNPVSATRRARFRLHHPPTS